ncbi:MAG: RIP metalloprotease RseP [Bacillota bacterium]
MQTAFLALIIFGLLIFVHEFGHFIIAKLVGIRVEEFSIGMGPKAFSFQKGETVYSIRILPIGGYVKMSGETGIEEENEYLNDPKHFNNKSVGQRAGVIVAGPLMNFMLAVVLFALIFAFIGIPYGTTQIGDIMPDSPAAKAGLQKGDKIVSIDNTTVDEWSEMVNIIHSSPNKELSIKIVRKGEQQIFQITPKLDADNGVGLIGITPDKTPKKVNIFNAVGLGITRTVEILYFTIYAIIEMVGGNADMGEVAGPVGIVQLIGESAQIGLIYLINLTALISINLGLLNLLPIPALDGSKLIFLGIEALRGKPIDARKENFVHILGFAILMTLMLFITYRDIAKLFD